MVGVRTDEVGGNVGGVVGRFRVGSRVALAMLGLVLGGAAGIVGVGCIARTAGIAGVSAMFAAGVGSVGTRGVVGVLVPATGMPRSS